MGDTTKRWVTAIDFITKHAKISEEGRGEIPLKELRGKMREAQLRFNEGMAKKLGVGEVWARGGEVVDLIALYCDFYEGSQD